MAGLADEVPLSFTSKLIAFVCKTLDLEFIRKLVESAGLRLSGVWQISRTSATGETLSWQMVAGEGHVLAGSFPFLQSVLRRFSLQKPHPMNCSRFL